MKPSGLLNIFILFMQERCTQRCVRNLIRTFFIVILSVVQTFHAFWKNLLEVVAILITRAHTKP